MVEVDASGCEVGAVLSQRSGNKLKLHPAAFFFHKLSSAERNYDVSNRVLRAVKLSGDTGLREQHIYSSCWLTTRIWNTSKLLNVHLIKPGGLCFSPDLISPFYIVLVPEIQRLMHSQNSTKTRRRANHQRPCSQHPAISTLSSGILTDIQVLRNPRGHSERPGSTVHFKNVEWVHEEPGHNSKSHFWLSSTGQWSSWEDESGN